MTRSGRSLLRQASVLLLLFCFGAVRAPALAQGTGAGTWADSLADAEA